MICCISIIFYYTVSFSFSFFSFFLILLCLSFFNCRSCRIFYLFPPRLSLPISFFPVRTTKAEQQMKFCSIPSSGSRARGSLSLTPLWKWRLCLCSAAAVRGRRIWPSWTGHRCPVSALTKSKEAVQESKRAQRTSPRDEESPQLHLFPSLLPPSLPTSLWLTLNCCSRSCFGFVSSCSAGPVHLFGLCRRREGTGGGSGGSTLHAGRHGDTLPVGATVAAGGTRGVRGGKPSSSAASGHVLLQCQRSLGRG